MPTLDDIIETRTAIAPYVDETPIMYSTALRTISGHQEVILKCENLQRTGSYHLRGAVYSVIRHKEKDLGINNFITHSSGNTGVAMACAAHSFQSTARVVVPKDIGQLLIKRIKHFDGASYPCEPTQEARDAAEKKLMKEFNGKKGGTTNRAVVIHPYNDEDLISGYGTLGLELMEQIHSRVDCVVVPVGGGALLSGVAIAVKGMKPNVAVFAAEPEKISDKYLSFKRGELTADRSEEKDKDADGVPLKSAVTEVSKDSVNNLVEGVIRVSDADIKNAFRHSYERCKLVVDRHTAVAVAAVLSRPKELTKYRRIAIVIAGGNVDLKDVPKLAGANL